MELGSYLVSWVVTYVVDLRPTYMGFQSIYEVPWTSQ